MTIKVGDTLPEATLTEFIEIEGNGCSVGPNAFKVADLVKGVRGREGLASGDTNHGVWSAGMVQGLIHDIPTCEVLLTRMVADAEAIIRGRLGAMLAD